MEERRIGLIAGAGDLPAVVARSAREKGFKVISVALSRDLVKPLEPFSERVFCYGVGQPTRILRSLAEEDVKNVLIIGKINKGVIFSRFRFDLRALRFLRKVKEGDDDSLMNAIRREFEREGINILDQRMFLEDLCPESGLISGNAPDQREWQDILYGYAVAKKIGEIGVGQTVVVKDRVVLAVEAIEGTDEAIRRGCRWCGKGAVVVKVSRPHQDLRWDLPVMGPGTIEVMIEGKASALAVEAGKTLIMDRAGVVDMADGAGISIVAIDEAAVREMRERVN